MIKKMYEWGRTAVVLVKMNNSLLFRSLLEDTVMINIRGNGCCGLPRNLCHEIFKQRYIGIAKSIYRLLRIAYNKDFI